MNRLTSLLVVCAFCACGLSGEETSARKTAALRGIGDGDEGGDTGGGTAGPLSLPVSQGFSLVNFDDVEVTFECGYNADVHGLLVSESGGAWREVSTTTCSGGELGTLADQTVEPGKSYCWLVEARSAFQSGRSARSCATVPLDPRPVTPPRLTATFLDMTTAQFILEDRSDNEDGFRLEGRVLGTEAWTGLAVVPRGRRRHAPVGEVLPRIADHRFELLPGEAWEFRAQAYKEFAPAEAFGAPVRACTLSLGPTDARVVNVTSDSVRVEWNLAPGAAGYDIVRQDGFVGAVGAGVATFTAVKLAADTPFCFEVYARNACGVRNPTPSEACTRTLPAP